MVTDSEEVNANVVTGISFMQQLPETQQKYLGKYDYSNPREAKAGVLRNHLLVRKNYEGLVSGDGACAGCGEKSVLRALATVTEAYMRPLFHDKADRLDALATRIESEGSGLLEALAQRSPEQHALFGKTVAHIVMGLGGENEKDTQLRLEQHGPISDQDLVDALVSIMRQDAFNHRDLQANDGRLADGMSVMAMGAHTGCNTVFGSTPPNNPHPYPWMNSLFQDGATVGWMFGESFIHKYSRRSILPERLGRALLDNSGEVVSEADYFDFTHFSDVLMTDQEIRELPKAWVIGGDGGMGDIGFQNVSKVVLQNRPNVKLLMLDTQVYSNTGGQNSDSSPMLGGGDMNGLGDASQGKLNEKKSVSEIMTAGHGSPFVAQLSMANPTRLFRTIIDGLDYRGTAVFQCFTTCQPEHGVADDVSQLQAKLIRDARGMPDFVFNPALGETYGEALELKGNPSVRNDWTQVKSGVTGEKYSYTIAHWASTEARFRRHSRRISAEEAADMVHLDEMLLRITQNDAVNRRHLRRDHRAYIPDWGVYIVTDGPGPRSRVLALSRQMVLFCVERRKAWRMLQSRAGIENPDYKAQKALLARVDKGEISLEDFLARGSELLADAAK
jgi:pyruvate-ferredoxin/flavodoxin oxidoreductase